jgi:hypothetical protein
MTNYNQLKQAQQILKSEMPHPRISRTVDAHPQLTATDRGALLFHSIKKVNVLLERNPR